MQFTTLSLLALSIGSSLAQTVHVVTVGGSNGTTEFSPNNLQAAVGDLVQFQFNPKNHTVTQSNFDNPCVPIQNVSPNITGFFSGFMGVSASDAMRPAFTIAVTSASPVWVYCSQAKHCQAGMSMVINENTAVNATRSLANYQLSAKSAPQNLAPTFSSSSNSSSSSGSSSSGSSSSGSGTSSSNSGTSTTSAGTAASATTAGAGMIGVSSLLSLVVISLGLVLV